MFVEVKETLVHVLDITARDEMDALSKAEDMYRNEEVVLDYNDYAGVEFRIVKPQTYKVVLSGDGEAISEWEYPTREEAEEAMAGLSLSIVEDEE